jgi:hypothetical protein
MVHSPNIAAEGKRMQPDKVELPKKHHHILDRVELPE